MSDVRQIEAYLEYNLSYNYGYFRSTIAGLINASEAVILSAVITRATGLNDAGIMSIAFAIGNLMMTIGKFGVFKRKMNTLVKGLNNL